MTIDQTNGNLYFLFYDRRNYTNLQTDVYMALSSDGGDSFINFKVSETPFTPSQYNFLGHYNGVSAHNNIVRPVWTRIDNNLNSLWTALVDSVTSVEEYPEQIEVLNYKLFQNYPNPFNPNTVIGYQLSVISNVTLKVYDVLGNEIATLVNEEKLAGTYEVNFDAAGLPSGLYLYKLSAGDMFQIKKMVLLK
ncbi:MAG: T9SS type A sorting domain-containing protein [bacterium]|nr:T9SS type A sorting domain-containing protein [bacterium]